MPKAGKDFLQKRRWSYNLSTGLNVVLLLASGGESSGMKKWICSSFVNLFHSIGVDWWVLVSLL